MTKETTPPDLLVIGQDDATNEFVYMCFEHGGFTHFGTITEDDVSLVVANRYAKALGSQRSLTIVFQKQTYHMGPLSVIRDATCKAVREQRERTKEKKWAREHRTGQGDKSVWTWKNPPSSFHQGSIKVQTQEAASAYRALFGWGRKPELETLISKAEELYHISLTNLENLADLFCFAYWASRNDEI